MLESKYFPIPSARHYYGLQRAIAEPERFERVDGARFPRASLARTEPPCFVDLRPYDHDPRDDVYLVPGELDELAQRMWAKRDALSDRDVDVLDAVMATWIRETRSPSDMVLVRVDELLASRGLKLKKNGQGRRSGFEETQRVDLWQSLFRLRDLWIDLGEVSLPEIDPSSGRRHRKQRRIASCAIVLDEIHYDPAVGSAASIGSFLARPGTAIARFLLGPGRQVALLSCRALRYHSKRQVIEKRLARFLAWHWRVGAKSASFVRRYGVRTLLEETGLQVDCRNPSRTRKRFEKALGELQSDEVIAGWHYCAEGDKNALPGRGWIPLWLRSRIEVEAPDIIKTAYSDMQRVELPRSVGQQGESGRQVKQKRREIGISQKEASEEIGVSQSYLSELETGRRKPGRKTQQRIQEWLSR